ncbi:zinc-finger domain-containing protein [Bacillus sp. V3B]|uniref:zinc-finger domain-containing protein n=1 Tax=Bacillus sp. V3B TaxID=2804915 RepID=UPI00210CA690|nr:zinc-finger domain-containing protein [Bacillus sp. V3B]MCQ6273958.1 zinc-finger domain-containing protein [Bacillus sp. V3B]
MKRKEIYHKVEAIMNNYCNGCFLYKQNRKDKGRSSAHRFCISSCTVGEKLRQYGEKLTR